MMLQGIPEKPKKKVRVYRYDEVPGYEYRVFVVCLYYIAGIILMICGHKNDINGLPSLKFVAGATICLTTFIVLVMSFIKVNLTYEEKETN